MYALSLPLQLLMTGGFLKQGGMALVVITAVHAGVITALFWGLLASAVVATQVVDGTLSALRSGSGWFFALLGKNQRPNR